MRRFLIALLSVMSMLALCLIGPQQVQAAPQIHEQASYYYYYPFQDSNGGEWIAIPSYQLSQDQDYWIVFPAALVAYSDGSYNIPGSWWWGTEGNSYYLYYRPDYPLTNYQVTQQVTTSVIETVTTSVNFESVYGSQSDEVQAEFGAVSLSSVSSSSYIQSS